MIDWNTQALRQHEREQDNAEDRMRRIRIRQADLLAWECNPTHVENIEEAWPNLNIAGIVELLEKGETDSVGKRIADAIQDYWKRRAWDRAESEITSEGVTA